MFGDRLPLVSAYAERLAGAGVERGLIGPREVPRLWDRHVLNCAAIAEVIPEGATLADVGSGAGLPGVVLAILRPDLRITLIEPLLRRTRFLAEVVDELGLPTVRVLRARAEEVPRALRDADDAAGAGSEGAGAVAAGAGTVRGSADTGGPSDRLFDVVTARAVAPLQRLAGWCLPLVRADGRFIAMKGERAQLELDQAEERLARLGAVRWGVLRCDGGRTTPDGPPTGVALNPPTVVVEVVAGARPVSDRRDRLAPRTRRTKDPAAGSMRRRRGSGGGGVDGRCGENSRRR